MEIKAQEISRVLCEEIRDYQAGVELAEVGSVISVGDGIARIHGLEKAASGELLIFPHDLMGIALNLEEDSVGAVLMGESEGIREGDVVKRTKRIVQIPVGDAVIGRVINVLGEPIDGGLPIETDATGRIEVKAPGNVKRKSVHEPLQTGRLK